MNKGIDWKHHSEQYEVSGMNSTNYCKQNNLSLSTFRRHRYTLAKQKKESNKSTFKTYGVGLSFKIRINDSGLVGIDDLDPKHLPIIVQAISAL